MIWSTAVTTVITITERRPGTFEYSLQSPSKRLIGGSAGSDPAAAAAKAMDLAISFGAPYQIFAPQRVLDLIPADLQRKESQ